MSWSAAAAAALMLGLAPALSGIAAKTKAILTGRRGAPVIQLYADLAKLMRKGAVYAPVTTWVFRLAPVGMVVTAVVALVLLPLDGRRALLAFPGDFVAFAYILALGRFLLVLGALDTGSSFEGLGASREVTVATFAEPALFLGLATLGLATGGTSMSELLGPSLGQAWSRTAAACGLVAVALFILLLAENARVPVDDPQTHLELTMIHEVMVLDHSGPDLALVLYGAALKLALFAGLMVSLLLPRGVFHPAAALAALAVGLAVVAAGVGVVESLVARLRLNRVPQLLVAAGTLAAFGVILVLVA